MSVAADTSRRLGPRQYACVCERCGEEFVGATSVTRFCSKVCSVAAWQAANPERSREHKRNTARRMRGDADYAERGRAANRVYKRRNRARCSERERLRKAGIRDPSHPQFIEPVDREVVYRMHGGRCGICTEFVSASEFEVDHVVPLSKGGQHGYVNVQPSHALCNQRKYNQEDSHA